MQYTVGQLVYFVPASNSVRSGYITVSKVGRKYATLGGRDGYRVPLGSNKAEPGFNGVSQGTVYPDKAAHDLELRTQSKWDYFRRKVSDKYRHPEHLTEVDIDFLAKTLGITFPASEVYPGK